MLRSPLFSVLTLVTALVAIAVPVAGSVLLGLRTSGIARVLGVAGCLTMAIGVGWGFVWYWLVPSLIRGRNNLVVLQAGNLLGTVGASIGLGLLIGALLADRPGRR